MEMIKNKTPIDIDIDEDLLFQIMLLAHERDITLNQMVNFILSESYSEPIINDSQLTLEF
jgi:hypothetical protein